jgi:hypothetical protein
LEAICGKPLFEAWIELVLREMVELGQRSSAAQRDSGRDYLPYGILEEHKYTLTAARPAKGYFCWVSIVARFTQKRNLVLTSGQLRIPSRPSNEPGS